MTGAHAEEGRKIFHERLGRPLNDLNLKVRRQDVLRDVKWKVFLARAERFRHVPFVDFVFAAGSMALGNVHAASDFDVLVGCRYGRIFTARFFCIVLFGLFKERREKLSHHEEASDKICFNHFVTEKSLRLSPPRNLYWQELYRNLVPLYGSREKVRAFLAANDWAGANANQRDLRHREDISPAKRLFEAALSGSAGDFLEAALRRLQLGRIKRNLERDEGGFEPRLIYSDAELEFHPDTKRIHDLVANL